MIYSDSKSSIQAIQLINSTHPIVAKILRTLVRLTREKTVKFCWVPSHVGVAGNEKVDGEANRAGRGIGPCLTPKYCMTSIVQ